MKKIAFVEDDKFLVRIYKAKMINKGYDVIAIEDSTTAVATIKEFNPDIIITDIIMPETDGFRLIYDLKNDPKTRHIPIFVLTNLSQDEDKTKLIGLGAEIFLIKADYSFQEVIESIEKRLMTL